MTERGTESGTGDEVIERIGTMLAQFQERMDRLEDGLSAQVDSVRGSAEAIDMLTDEVRRSLQAVQDDGAVEARLIEIEKTLARPGSAPSVRDVDLTPVTSALAEVLEAVALQSETARSDRRALQDEVETLRSEVRSIPGPVDLSALHDHLDRLTEHVTATAPRPVDLSGVTSSIVGLHQRVDALADTGPIDRLRQRLDDLAAAIAERRPESVDLTPLSADIADLRTHIADSRPDLTPLQARLAEIAAASDTAALGDRLDEVGRRVDGLDSRLDLAPIQNALAEVVDALAQQIDDSRSSSANALAAIEVLADRVRESRTDLQPIDERLATVADAQQLDDLRNRLDALAGAIAEQRPEPVDLTPLSAAIADLRTHIADSRPDLAPLHARLDEITASTDTSALDEGLATLGRSLESLAAAVRENGVDLDPVQQRLATLADAQQLHDLRNRLDALAGAIAEQRPEPVDLTPIVAAVDALRHHYDDTQPDLDALVEAMKAMRAQIITGVHEAAEANRVDLQPLMDGVDAQRSAQEATLDRLRSDLAPEPVDLGPVLAAVDGLRASMPQIDLIPVEERLESLASAMPTLDLAPVLRAVTELQDSLPPATDLTPVLDAVAEVGRQVPPPADLEPVRQAIADLGAALPPAADLDPVRDDLASLRHTLDNEIDSVRDRIDSVRASMPSVDLAPVLAAIESVRHELPDVDLDPVLRAIESVHSDLPTVDLGPVVDAVETVRRELPDFDLAKLHAQLADLATKVDDTSDIERVRAAIEHVAEDVAGARAESARSEMVDQLSQRLDSLQATVDSIRADDALRDTELRLSHRVDANSESLRAKIDDQRALADSLAANVSQLNAALTLASEQPQQLRRDLDRTLEQLAERLGGAMRDLRKELESGDEPLALRSSVEAGLDRITGRFQTDTSRILEAVAAAQDDADGRLRRIDNQMTELRRAVDRARRETDRLEGAPQT